MYQIRTLNALAKEDKNSIRKNFLFISRHGISSWNQQSKDPLVNYLRL